MVEENIFRWDGYKKFEVIANGLLNINNSLCNTLSLAYSIVPHRLVVGTMSFGAAVVLRRRTDMYRLTNSLNSFIYHPLNLQSKGRIIPLQIQMCPKISTFPLPIKHK